MTLANIVMMVIAFGLLIIIHELGHFLMARAFGVHIQKFSVGFGKPLFKVTRGGTEYLLSLIPLGGYVKMQGDNPEERDEAEQSDPERDFLSKAWWKKALIVLAGPFANLLLGLLLFIFALALPQKQEDLAPVLHSVEGKWAEIFSAGDSLISVNGKSVPGFNAFLLELSQHSENKVVFTHAGHPQSLTVAAAERDSLIRSLKPLVSTRIGEVFTGMPAWKAGLQEGDIILAVDSVAVSDWYDMRERIIASEGNDVLVQVQRKDDLFTRRIPLQDTLTGDDERMIGIMQYLPVKQTIRYTPVEAIQYGSLSTFGFISMQYSGLFRLAQKPSELKNNVGGPVMLVSMANDVGSRGISSILLFFASISLILMIMNLLPIPILDGGHIMFFIIEGIIGKPVPLKVQGIAQRIGFALLLWLMLFAFYADISRLISRMISLR
ncbi:MAG TPA: RIP metalloprotease RseP [Candidatus Cloacimonadota bacterium]|nr:RIP metalloprotease RseP [Candidatus Cloacimonadota bacterium]